MMGTAKVLSIAVPTTSRALVESGLTAINTCDWAEPVDAGKWVDGVFARRRLGGKASAMWIERPHLKEAAINLLDYVTPFYPGATSPLAQEVLLRAFHAYQDNVDSGRHPAREIAFLTEISMAADVLMLHRVIAVGRDAKVKSWDVFKTPLLRWLQTHKYEQFYMKPREKQLPHEVQGARTALSAKVMDYRELGLLQARRRTDCE